MRITWILALCLVLGGTTAALAADPPDLEKKASYIIGYDMAKRMIRDGVIVPIEFKRGLTDALGGKAPGVPKAEVEAVMKAFQKKVRAAMMVKRKAMMAKRFAADKQVSAKNLEAGKAFLAANAKKPGVKTTASGLQYLVLREGKGLKPKATDRAQVHYRGRLLDGREFDSSHKRKKPFTFSLSGGVIQGWIEGVRLMNVGAKFRFFVPSPLAYGARRMGPMISPNSTLIFDVDLLGLEKPGRSPLKMNFPRKRPLKMNFPKKRPLKLKFNK